MPETLQGEYRHFNNDFRPVMQNTGGFYQFSLSHKPVRLMESNWRVTIIPPARPLIRTLVHAKADRREHAEVQIFQNIAQLARAGETGHAMHRK